MRKSNLLLFTCLHPLVDFCSMVVLAMGGLSIERVLAYNTLAFALQLPLGMALDCAPKATRGAFCGGILLVALGTATMGARGWGPLVAACLGNALFHLTAGAQILKSTPRRSGPIGAFISTGALGLAAGSVLGATLGESGLSIFMLLPPVLLVVGGFLAVIAWPKALAATAPAETRRGNFKTSREPLPSGRAVAPRPPHRGELWQKATVTARLAGGGRPTRGGFEIATRQDKSALVRFCLLLGLFAVTAGRSLAGMRIAEAFETMSSALALTVAAKFLGGYLTDAIGKRYPSRWTPALAPRPVVIALSAVAACAALVPSDWGYPVLALILAFFVQLSTGPVFALIYEESGDKPGTAFGFACLALFIGSLGIFIGSMF